MTASRNRATRARERAAEIARALFVQLRAGNVGLLALVFVAGLGVWALRHGGERSAPQPLASASDPGGAPAAAADDHALCLAPAPPGSRVRQALLAGMAKVKQLPHRPD